MSSNCSHCGKSVLTERDCISSETNIFHQECYDEIIASNEEKIKEIEDLTNKWNEEKIKEIEDLTNKWNEELLNPQNICQLCTFPKIICRCSWKHRYPIIALRL